MNMRGRIKKPTSRSAKHILYIVIRNKCPASSSRRVQHRDPTSSSQCSNRIKPSDRLLPTGLQNLPGIRYDLHSRRYMPEYTSGRYITIDDCPRTTYRRLTSSLNLVSHTKSSTCLSFILSCSNWSLPWVTRKRKRLVFLQPSRGLWSYRKLTPFP